jgi:hypothetical protein
MISKRKKVYVVQKDGSRIDINNNFIPAHKKCKAGNMLYKGHEIPINAKIIKDKNGEECYLSGIVFKEDLWFATLCYFQKKTDNYLTVLYSKVNPYL